MSFITMRESFIEEIMDGINACVKDLEGSEIYDIYGAIAVFKLDPPNTPFQTGYHAGLVHIEEHGLIAMKKSLISGEIREVVEELNE